METTRTSLKLTLTPPDNQRLASLCGEHNQHIQQIERHFNVEIHHRGHLFHISGEATMAKQARRILSAIYHETEQEKMLTPAQVHYFINAANHPPRRPSADRTTGYTLQTKRLAIKCLTPNQEKYLDRINQHDINFAIGPAGTGKTYLAVACAVEALEQEKIQRIVLVRPAVEAGEKLGFLPGDLAEKVNPYLRPLYDALYEMMGVEKVVRLVQQDVIEVAPLAYMRGRTLNDSFIIMDEAQNTTQEQMKMFLTRIGFGSKVIVTGDVTQVDLPKHIDSGLTHAVRVLENMKGISFTYFEAKDTVRHPLVQSIILAYDNQRQKENQKPKEA